jgi:hypothetical protein
MLLAFLYVLSALSAMFFISVQIFDNEALLLGLLSVSSIFGWPNLTY